MRAYEAIVNLAHDSGWSLTPYIAPIRNDGETPYVESEYALFKRDLTEYSAKVFNLENLIPINFWDEETVREAMLAGLILCIFNSKGTNC